MNRHVVLMLIVGLTAGRAAYAQTPTPQWEYGQLTAIQGTPYTWIAGDSVVVLDSAFVRMRAQTTAEFRRSIEPPQPSTPGSPPVKGETLRQANPLVATLNRIGAQGWDLVSVTTEPSGMVYHFKRRRP